MQSAATSFKQDSIQKMMTTMGITKTYSGLDFYHFGIFLNSRATSLGVAKLVLYCTYYWEHGRI
jgi:hypothetical protein